MKASVTVLVTLLAFIFTASSALAQDLGFKGVGGKVGFAKPEDVDGTVGFGAHVDLGEIIENLKLFPSVEYFKTSEGSVDFSVFSVNGDVRFYFPTTGTAKFFGGGGVALHFTSQDVPDFFGGTQSESQTDVGVNILAGLDYPVSPNIMVGGEAKFIVSDQNGFKVQGTVTVLLPQ